MPGRDGAKSENLWAFLAGAIVLSLVFIGAGWMLGSTRKPVVENPPSRPPHPVETHKRAPAQESPAVVPLAGDSLSMIREANPADARVKEEKIPVAEAKPQDVPKDSALRNELAKMAFGGNGWNSQPGGGQLQNAKPGDGARSAVNGSRLSSQLDPVHFGDSRGWKLGTAKTPGPQARSGVSAADGPKDGLAQPAAGPFTEKYPEALNSSHMKDIIDAIKRHAPQAMSSPTPNMGQDRERAAAQAAAQIAGADPRMQEAVHDWLLRGASINARGVQDPYMKGYFAFVDAQTAPGYPPGADLPPMVVAADQSGCSGGHCGQVLGWWDEHQVGITQFGLTQDLQGRLLTVTHEMLHVYDTGDRHPNVSDRNPIGVNKYGQDGSSFTAETLAYSEMHCIFNLCP